MTLSLSTSGFTSKPSSKTIAALEYTKVEISIDELIQRLTNGYCFSNIYDFDGNFKFFGKGIKVNHYIGSYSINIDLDHQAISMEEAYNKCTLKPTFCYESWSNSDSNYSYRFIYVFTDFIEGVESYKQLYQQICETNGLDYDKNAASPYQYMNGTSFGSKVIASYQEYSIKDFNLTREHKRCKPIHNTNDHNNMIGFVPFSDKQFETDFYNLSFKDILDKYNGKLINKESSDIPETNEDTPMIDLTGFYEIHRLFRKSDGRCIRLKNGQNRKRKLYFNCLVRRLITPSIEFDDLLYDMVFEVYNYIDNRDDSITKKQLIEIVQSALNADIDKFKTFYKGRKSMVNPKYQLKYGMSKRQIANEANANACRLKKEQLYQSIGELYDLSKTVNENLKVLEDYGIKVSRRTIQNWKKDNHLTRDYECAKPIHNTNDHNNMIGFCTFSEDTKPIDKEEQIEKLKETIIKKIENDNNYVNTHEFSNDIEKYAIISGDKTEFQMSIYFKYIDGVA